MEKKVNIKNRSDLVEYCDTVFKSLYKIYPEDNHVETILCCHDSPFIKDIQNLLIEEKIIECTATGLFNTYKLTMFGKELFEKGNSIKNHIERKEKEHKTELENEKIKNKNTLIEYKMSKWKYYTFWPIFIIGLLGGIYSIVSIVQNFKENPEIKIRRFIKEELKQMNKTDTLNFENN